MDDFDIGIDDAVDTAMSALEKDGLLEEGQEGSTQGIKDNEQGESPEQNGADEQPTEDNKDKPNEQEQDEATKLIEPPASWRSDEKEVFATLDRNAQEAILRVNQAQESHFTQRSTELATKIRATDDERQQYQTQRASFLDRLGQLNQMASQLMPAKFQDIKSEADYLRLKATDPARASEFEAFQGTLRMAQSEQQRVQKAQLDDHLGREWQALVEKTPNQDVAKAKEAVDAARKTATEYYGFTPQEVAVVQDHRHIAILNDAAAWRSYQANLKAAQSKKTVTTPTKVLRQQSSNGSTPNDSKKAALLNRARNSNNTREQADAITRLISAG